MDALTLRRTHRAAHHASLVFDDAVEIWKRYLLLAESPGHIARAFRLSLRSIRDILDERRHVGSRLVALGQNPLAADPTATQQSVSASCVRRHHAPVRQATGTNRPSPKLLEWPSLNGPVIGLSKIRRSI
jgi:hypothetical protein